MNKQVTKREFKYLKGLCLKCLSENPSIAKRLDHLYRLIQVYFFYENTDQNAADSLRSVLNDPTITYSTKPTPAFCQSRKNIGCIMVFVKHLNESAQEREDKDRFNQGHFFEELYHLVQLKGDSSIHPSSYWILWDIYTRKGLQQYGNKIIEKLDSTRQHYEFYPIMIKSYAEDWVDRCWKYFDEYIDYWRVYEDEKRRYPIDVVYASLIRNYLNILSVLYVTEKVPRQHISDEHKKRLEEMRRKGKSALELTKSLIQRDMGSDALHMVESLDENIFKTSEIFFSVVLDLWKSLHLV